MFFSYLVDIPTGTGKITYKKQNDTTYVEYTYERSYNPLKKYNTAKRKTIGKQSKEDASKMYPNQNFSVYFPDVKLPEEPEKDRSRVLQIGPYLVIDKIVREYHLDTILLDILGKGSGLFLDLAAYSIITEGNAAQHYPDYAYNHPLFTEDMHIYSDSKISDFLQSITADQNIAFMNEWNVKRNKNDRIYISYDASNKNCQAGDIDFAEFGHAKDDDSKPVVSCAIAYDTTNSEPLFYEEYPGSIADITQLQYYLQKVNAYGYKNIGHILNRGYFSKKNIDFMDQAGDAFIIMMKGRKKLVSELVIEKKGTFENKWDSYIPEYNLHGTTVQRKLFESDSKDRYFHVFFSGKKEYAESYLVKSKILRYQATIEKLRGKEVIVPTSFEKYFELYYSEKNVTEKGKKITKKVFLAARPKTDVIDLEMSLCGYFVIITSEKMDAREALMLYKSRDASEKLFMADKTFLGGDAMRVQSQVSLDAKMFIEFVALIIRNKIYTRIKDYCIKNSFKQNYMNVPSAIRELGKLEMWCQADGVYRLDHAVTKTQKTILDAFGINAAYIDDRASMLGKRLIESNKKKAADKAKNAGSTAPDVSTDDPELDDGMTDEERKALAQLERMAAELEN